MSPPGDRLWQVTLSGSFAALKAWAAAHEALDDPPWLALSVFETALPAGEVQLLFADEDQARAFTAGADIDPDWRTACTPLDDENWVARSLRGLPVVRAGRFFVHGSHHEAPGEAGTVPILVDAGEAFGSGHHGTTRGCLLAFDAVLAEAAPQNVLDLGTGAGTLAIAAAKALPGACIMASDIDPVAVRVARENAARNGVAGRIALVTASGLDHAALSGKRFDLIFANILAGPLKAMAPAIAAALADGGQVLLSGILDSQAEDVRTAFTRAGLAFVRSHALGEWRVLVMRRESV